MGPLPWPIRKRPYTGNHVTDNHGDVSRHATGFATRFPWDPRRPAATGTAVIRPESDVTGRMNPSPPNINPNSGEGAVAFSASNMNTTLIQAFNPTAMQTPWQTLQQVVSDGVSVSDAHGLGATSQHAWSSQNNSLGMQPPQMFPGLLAAQTRQSVEQRGPALGNHESMDQWSGTIAWRGTDTTRNERTEVRAHVTAIASKGDPYATFL